MILTVTTFLTLDGVMQAPGGADEDCSGGFEHGGWLVPFFDDDLGQFMDATFAEADALLLGRTTHDLMQPYWSGVTDPDNRVATALNSLPRHVVTHRPESLTWAGSRPLGADLAVAVAALKEGVGRELQVHGSHDLVRQLLGTGLVDRFNVVTFPVLVGEGKRLFGEGTPAVSLRRLSGEITSAGAVISAYEPHGTLDAGGTFAVEGGAEVVRR